MVPSTESALLIAIEDYAFAPDIPGARLNGHGAPSADGSDGLLLGMDVVQSADSIQARGIRQTELLDVLHAVEAAVPPAF